MNDPHDSTAIAIIGMAGRFPGADTIDAFWQQLRDGREGISFFADADLVAQGIDEAMLRDPMFVKAGAVIADEDCFDAAFFGYSPREAELMDPQHRVFLECAWTALEDAGYVAETYPGFIGVYAGAAPNTYLVFNLISDPGVLKTLHHLDISDQMRLNIGNAGDYLTTRVSYKLNLRGPSHQIQSACSTSLVAVHLACQSLLYEECDLALAGGVSVNVNQRKGYRSVSGAIASPDGHCRSFDARAQGTVFGSGVGVVVLRRLSDALAAGDHIYAVIKGSASNNDGALKVGYTAPSVDGQAAVIAAALANAEVSAATISYVEAHGTATPLGDPIEVQALTKAFRTDTDLRGFCAIGSVKSNVGHLDAAAGITGLIKAALALKHRQIPPSLHFEQPNPNIDFASSPFYVNTSLSEWKAGSSPRRAGVSAFGVGGTNAHIILEEAPVRAPLGAARSWQLLPLSAKTSAALDTATDQLAAHLAQHADLNLADVAFTLQMGRQEFNHRRMLVCRDGADALDALATRSPKRLFSDVCAPTERPVVFLFPGQGAQHVRMAADLYREEPAFREQVDRCAELLQPHLDFDLRAVLFPSDDHVAVAEQVLEQTWLAQPALFMIEYALAQLWMSLGVRPAALIGHSIGEYVAACLAGVFSLEDALALVAMRGQLMQQLPEGAMLAISLSAAVVEPLLGSNLSLAAINGPDLSVVAGAIDAIAELHDQLVARGVECRRLHTSHAFHSWMMDPIVELFTTYVRQIALQPPRIPYLSNVSGTWMTARDAQDPRYWARHLRQTVRFADGLHELLQKPDQILLEVGPGRTLSTLVRKRSEQDGLLVLTSLRHPHDQQPDDVCMLTTLGRLWLAGVPVNWQPLHVHERRQRVRLPTYPFARQRYWIDPQPWSETVAPLAPSSRTFPNGADWFSTPIWKSSVLPVPVKAGTQAEELPCWLVFTDERGWGVRLVERLEQRGHDVISVVIGDGFARLADRVYCLHPERGDQYDALIQALHQGEKRPQTIVHLWSITADDQPAGIVRFASVQACGFYPLLWLAQALGRQQAGDPVQLVVVSNDMQGVAGESVVYPEKATLMSACRVIPHEYPHISCRSIDLSLPEPGTWQAERLLDHLAAEIIAHPPAGVVAYRGTQRWVQAFESIGLGDAAQGQARLRRHGVYLFTGGLEDLNGALAEYLARTVQATLIVIAGVTFPRRAEWDGWLAAHPDSDDTSGTIRHIQALERLGAQVVALDVDATDYVGLSEALARIDQRFGSLHGVFHSAGLGGAMATRAIQEISQADCAPILTYAAQALFTLERVLQGLTLDFCFVQAALSSVVGGAGRLGEAAVSLFTDAFVQQHNRTHPTSWLCVHWDDRHLAAGTSAPAVDSSTERVSSAEGVVSVFLQLLSAETPPHVLVSTGALDAPVARRTRAVLGGSAPDEAQNRAPVHTRAGLQNAYLAPSSAIEHTIVLIWQELLGIAQVGVHDDFFALGGHSLLATQLVSRLHEAVHVELPLRSIFEAPTVAELIARIATAQTSAQETLAPTIPRIARTGYLPLSYAQQRLWTLDWMQPGSPVYTMPAAVRLYGALNEAALEQSLSEIVRRHETLRTTFALVHGQPMQLITPTPVLALPRIDLSPMLEHERTAEVQRLIFEESRRPFELSSGPLVRFSLLRLDGEEHVLFLNIHHIIADFWSIGVLIGELTALYEAFAAGRPTPIPELPIQYADFAHWQQQWLQAPGARGQGSGVRGQAAAASLPPPVGGGTEGGGETRRQGDKETRRRLETPSPTPNTQHPTPIEEQLAYWKRQLAGLPTLQLPTDRPRPAVMTFAGVKHWFVLPAALSEALTALSRRAGVTLFMTLLAAFDVLLHYYTAQDDIVVGTDVANRTRRETELLIGFFVNQLVLRADLSGNPSFSTLLDQVRATTLDAYAHQDVPFDQLVKALKLERDPSRTPLFQVKIVLQNVPMPSLDVAGLRLEPVAIDNSTAKYDLLMNLEDTGQGLACWLEYSTDLFEAASIARIVRHYEILLQAISVLPDRQVRELEELLADDDSQQRRIQVHEFEQVSSRKLKQIKRQAIRATDDAGE